MRIAVLLTLVVLSYYGISVFNGKYIYLTVFRQIGGGSV